MTAIAARNVAKRFRLGRRERYGSLRETLMRAAAAPFRRQSREELWALEDVSFDIAPGEAVGLIGKNGAGKSTLLKILSRITEPSRGEIVLNGRVGALLEVGTGFHPELTGRENIFLNGAILGMKRTEIARNFEEIVAFAEVEKFLDTPVKHYSSGMYMRLAFAVAAHLEPEILLVDEVLAVGDAAFQKKCLGKMNDVAHDGRTIIFVSHNMGAIKGLCSRAIWIDRGRVAGEGSADQVIARYMESIRDGFVVGAAKPRDKLVVDRVLLKDASGAVTSEFRGGEPITVEIHYQARQRIERPHFIVGVAGPYGPLFIASMVFDDLSPPAIEGAGAVAVEFRPPMLLPQTYTVILGARGSDGTTPLMDSKYDVAFFTIGGMMSEYGFPGPLADTQVASSTSMIVPYTWRLPDGRQVAGPTGRAGAGRA